MKKSIIFLAFMLLGILITSCSKDDEVASTLTVEDLTITVNEDISEGTFLGAIKANSTASEIDFKLVSQTPQDAIELQGSGNLSVNTHDAFNYELNTKVIAKVEASDVNEKKIVNITINIKDIDESNIPKGLK